MMYRKNLMLAGAHLRGDHSRTIKNGRVGSSMHTSAFVATNPTDEPITSGLFVTRELVALRFKWFVTCEQSLRVYLPSHQESARRALRYWKVVIVYVTRTAAIPRDRLC